MKNPIFLFIFTTFVITANWKVCTAIEPLTFTVTSIIALILVGTEFYSPPQNEYYEYQPELLPSLGNVRVDEDILNVERKIENIIEILPLQLDLGEKFQSLNEKMHRIDVKFSYLYKRVKANYNYELTGPETRSLLKDSEEYISAGNDSPYGLLKSVYNTLLSGPRSLLIDLDTLTKKSELACLRGSELQSIQQSFQQILTSIALSQMKVILTIKMSNELLYEHEGVYRRKTEDIKIDDLNDDFIEAIMSFKKIMKGKSRDVWRCDPEEHKEGVTYIELKNAFPKQLVYESADTEVRHVFKQKFCPANDDIDQETVYDVAVRKLDTFQLCQYSGVCEGVLRNCEIIHKALHLDINNKIGVCYSPPETGRRYERLDIYDENSELVGYFGKIEQCDQRNKQSLEVLGDESHVCTCENSKYYIYKQMVNSNYKAGYVITGVKIAERDGVIYPIIQEGLLLEEGLIDQLSVHWVDISETVEFNATNLHKITWSNRAVQLGIQDVEILSHLDDPNIVELMTGIQFGPYQGNPIDQTLTFTYASRPFDFTNGRLLLIPKQNLENSVYKTSASVAEDSSDTIVISDFKVPDSTLKSDAIIQDNKRIKFTASSFGTDLGQTTIPFFDMQSVTTYPATPMVAGGFYYKHRKGFAGHIAIKLKTLDMLPFLVVPDKYFLRGDEYVSRRLKLRDGRIGTYFNNFFPVRNPHEKFAGFPRI